jgi:zinc protease
MVENVAKHTLSNGLLILLKEIHTAPIISQWVWYRVGSRDETPGITGISHWVEHMQFKGTAQFPGGVLDKLISREGGQWNAFTYLDWTTYFETLPAEKIDLALRLEADRMQHSLFDAAEVTSERTVIISERQGAENEPLFRLSEALHRTAFETHPYGHEVIGDMEDLKTMSRADLYQHYRRYYVPNNAVVALAGDFDSEVMLTRLKELYEGIPPGELPSRQNISEPVQRSERPVVVEGPGETVYLKAGWRAPQASDDDFWSLFVMDSLLTGPSSPSIIGAGISNKTSRLYRALVDQELAVSVGGGLQATIDPYLYAITVVVHPERGAEQVVEALDAEIETLQSAPPPEEDLHRAVKQSRALFAYGTESITNQAAWLGYAEMFADYSWYTGYLDRLSSVTPADVHRVARKYLPREQRVLGTYLPTDNGMDGRGNR